MLLKLVLLPPLGHKKAIGTLGYPVASKMEDWLALEHSFGDGQTNTSLYNTDTLYTLFLKLRIFITISRI